MPKIFIGGTVIDFPDTGKDPAWSPAIVQFAQAVELALNSVSSEFDIPPSEKPLNNNSGTYTIKAFDSEYVRSFEFNYSIYRQTDAQTLTESGLVTAAYDTDAGDWLLDHSFTGERTASGEPYHTFEMVSGVLKVTIQPISGIDHIGSISYTAKTLPIG